MRTRRVETVLITGGGSGMGRAAAERLGREGCKVLVADLNRDTAREAADLIIDAGGRAAGFRVDVADPSSVAELFDKVREETERLDMLVHTAAILGDTVALDEMADEEWRRMMAVNLDGAFYCCRAALSWMKETGGGRILLFSSVAALTPTPGAIHYSAAKGAVNMLARSLALEAAAHNVRVNALAPGYIETPMLDGLPRGFGDYIIKKTPLKRLGRPNEVAGLVSFLASEEADFITGQIISPNGGLVI
jgi:NAD(P)-dependent dehydrogenase (short-subunit alcohol dehydrogenase family)